MCFVVVPLDDIEDDELAAVELLAGAEVSGARAGIANTAATSAGRMSLRMG